MEIAPMIAGPLLAGLIVIGIWEAIWKGIAMWKSARNTQLAWFVCILIFNTAGILSILYILFFQKRKVANVVAKQTPAKKAAKRTFKKRKR